MIIKTLAGSWNITRHASMRLWQRMGLETMEGKARNEGLDWGKQPMVTLCTDVTMVPTLHYKKGVRSVSHYLVRPPGGEEPVVLVTGKELDAVNLVTVLTLDIYRAQSFAVNLSAHLEKLDDASVAHEGEKAWLKACNSKLVRLSATVALLYHEHISLDTYMALGKFAGSLFSKRYEAVLPNGGKPTAEQLGHMHEHIKHMRKHYDGYLVEAEPVRTLSCTRNRS